MRISAKLLYANAVALVVNTLFLVLAVFKVCSFLVSVAIFVACLAGLTWLSCKINGIPARKFHAVETEPIRKMRI